MSYIKERLKQYKDEYSRYGKYDGLYVADVLEMLEQLQSDLEQDEKENGWIPVSEKLPEIKSDYDECYLVTDGRFCWMAYWTHEKEWIFADCTNCRNKIDWTDVVAWTELPKRYIMNENGE